MTRAGKFVVLEGGEGAGKSTNLEWIRGRLEAGGIKAITTREPGGTKFGEKLRGLLLDTASKIVPDTELLLMFAARAQHLHEVIKPALESGSWVICDRFTDASYAYQGGGRRMDLKHIEYLERWIQDGLNPDLVFLLDIPVETALHRTQRRGNAADRFELEQKAFFQRVRDGYLQRAKTFPERYRIIDATQELSHVQRQIANILDPMIAQWGIHAV